jgi:hypothetical protein
MFRVAIGGTGLQGDERLVRFIGHPDELTALLAGGLSLRKARDFGDTLEAAGTEADDRWISDFFGSQAIGGHSQAIGGQVFSLDIRFWME